MKRREFVTTAAMTVPLLASPLTASARRQGERRRRPPNVVLILADDLGYECLRCNNPASPYRTPRLDALAASGVRFTNAHATPLCTPTRVQMMTGKYNFRNYTEFGALKKGEETFAHLLRGAGYATGIAGKWQLAGSVPGTEQRGEGQLPAEAGFDEHCLWQVKRLGSRYWNPVLDVNGKHLPAQAGAYGPDRFAQFAGEFFERHRDRPFLFYYPMALPHAPWLPTPKSGDVTDAQRREDDPRWFKDCVEYMDTLVGRLVDRLGALGLAQDTLILFAGDNGTGRPIRTATAGGPYQGGKGRTTVAGTHVPLIARWAGRSPKGAVCEDLIDFTDVFPTLAGAAGAPVPAAHPRDGRTFLPQITGAKGTPREWVFCDYNPRWGKAVPARWVMDKRWKLYGDGRRIDLKNDPDEQKPLKSFPAEAGDVGARFEKVLATLR